MKNRNLRYIVNSNNNFIKDKDIIFKNFLKKILFGVIMSIIFSVSLLLLPMPKDVLAQKAESEIEDEMCISYNKSKNIISITCKYADFADVSKQIKDPEILKLETSAVSHNNNKAFSYVIWGI